MKEQELAKKEKEIKIGRETKSLPVQKAANSAVTAIGRIGKVDIQGIIRLA